MMTTTRRTSCYLIVPKDKSLATPLNHVKVKVGVTTNLRKRLTQLQASEPLQYVAVSDKGWTLETQLKTRFRPYLALPFSKEWFYLPERTYMALLENPDCQWELNKNKIADRLSPRTAATAVVDVDQNKEATPTEEDKRTPSSMR